MTPQNLPGELDKLVGNIIELSNMYQRDKIEEVDFDDEIKEVTNRIQHLIDRARIEELELIHWLYKENNDQSLDMKFVEVWAERVATLTKQQSKEEI